MKKLFIFAASSLLMLASCSESNDFVNNVAQDSPIAFSAYNGNGTRAGYAGDISSTTLQTTGFGVFAYNTGADDYGASGHSTMATTGETPTAKWAPNFMYNQQVTYSSGSSAWVYTPLKYWPNGIDTNGASQADVQKLSFFAYAPYVDSVSGEGSGITALSANDEAGDPKVTYALSGSGNDVDLLWGTTSTNGATVGNVAQAGVASDEYSGINVNENLTKMNTSGKVGFNFKHALAKIKDVQVKIAPDVSIEGTGTRPLTKITVSNITITSTNFTDTDKSEGEGKKSTKGGVFNLATGKWTLTEADAAQSSTEQITRTGDSGAHNVLNSTIVDPETVSAATIFGVSPASGITGVTTDYVTAYNSTTRRPLMLMPGTKPQFIIAITYTVRTEDANLAAGYSQTTQTITKTVQFGSAVELNKQYTLNLILGLTSIKVEATVSEWTDGSAPEISLPVNVEP